MAATTEPPPHDALLRPSRPTLALIALILRCGLGVQLMTVGVGGFLYNASRQYTNPSVTQEMGNALGYFPGLEATSLVVPYIQIVVGLALVLGFLTAYAAAVAVFLTLFPVVAQVMSVLVTGLQPHQGRNQEFFLSGALSGGTAAKLLLASAAVWFAPATVNVWSLDVLMFRPRVRARRPRVVGDPLGLNTPAEVTPQGKDFENGRGLLVPFDADFALDPDVGPPPHAEAP